VDGCVRVSVGEEIASVDAVIADEGPQGDMGAAKLPAHTTLSVLICLV
jgi:hypothetical protein